MSPLFHPAPPRFVALCGYPKAGKSTVAEFLAQRYGAHLVDDGMPLREACRAAYDLSWEDVYSQEGKVRTLEVCGKIYTHRQLLGDLGDMFKDRYGEFWIPEQAMRKVERSADDFPFYIFPGCRGKQGEFYQSHGGVVIEILRDGCVAENDFDRYEQSLVQHTLLNYGTTEELFQQAIELFEELGFRHRRDDTLAS